jgi:hypothetical protein
VGVPAKRCEWRCGPGVSAQRLGRAGGCAWEGCAAGVDRRDWKCTVDWWGPARAGSCAPLPRRRTPQAGLEEDERGTSRRAGGGGELRRLHQDRGWLGGRRVLRPAPSGGVGGK